MAIVNQNFLNLSGRYLFSEITSKVNAFQKQNPEADIIRMGIGDVSRPLVPKVIEAMHQATQECSCSATFRGYGPEHGYNFLRQAICSSDYKSRGIDIDESEVFISDGAKSDTGNIGDILSCDNLIGITDPVYPVYIDTNMMIGRKIQYITCTPENGFTGDIPSNKLDVVYLCYPNNPTGAVITREKLQKWVDYALANDCLLLFDGAYEAFIRDESIPRSVYEIPEAKRCAIEFRSFSKTAGFTGIRCGYTVVPRELSAAAKDGSRVFLNGLWERRQSCKFNGASYISQRAAEAVYSPEGQAQITADIDAYLDTAKIIRAAMLEMGLNPTGGDNSPYIWSRTPNGMPSWEFFDFLLEKAGVVMTPGAGFGQAGEGWFRLTAFQQKDRTIEAMNRIKKYIK